jgi:hypothetical protein
LRRREGGDWPTEVRGRRRAEAIRKDVRRHARVRLLLPCPWAWLAGPAQETMGRKDGYLCLSPIPIFRAA